MISGFTQLSAAANMYLNHTQHLLEQIEQPQYNHFSFTGHFRVYMHDRNNSKHTQKVLKSILNMYYTNKKQHSSPYGVITKNANAKGQIKSKAL